VKKIIYILAFTHLFIIFLTIIHALDKLSETKVSWIATSINFYCSLNYSVWRYGFFSPDVGRSNEIEIITYSENEKATKYSTLNGFNFFLNNNDLGKRFYGFKTYNAADTLIQDLCARSVATRMINLFPDTKKVRYTIRSIRYPTMQNFRKKEPIQINELYSTEFILE
jgi:hypothetical protein